MYSKYNVFEAQIDIESAAFFHTQSIFEIDLVCFQNHVHMPKMGCIRDIHILKNRMNLKSLD